MRDRDAFGQAIDHLRALLRSGRWVQGEQLVVTALAPTLGLSPTPVREALARLAGEGLIEDRRGAGYFARLLGSWEIRELFEVHGALLTLILGPGAPERPAALAAKPLRREASWDAQALDFFETAAAEATNRTAREVLARLRDRLAPVFRVEDKVLQGAEAELRNLASAPIGSAQFQSLLSTYHARRAAAAETLAWAVRAQAEALAKK